jgi:EmrB/QacA subfamily drug resistance transporter
VSEPAVASPEKPEPRVAPDSGPRKKKTDHEGALTSYPHRWAALAVIAIAQLVIVLDTSIMNVALPSAAKDLSIPDSSLQWVVTAYTLTFGGLLLLGGRIADFVGRKNTFIIGLLGFAVASAIGGAALNEGMLFTSRAIQGGFAAILAPSALALITVMFVEPHERAKAFGVFGAIAGGGAAIGLLAGGVLTEYLDWRWCLYVNIPIAVIAAIFAFRLVPQSKAEGDTKLDIPGAVLSIIGLATLVYGFTEASKQQVGAGGAVTTVGWTDPTVLTLLAVAVVALVAFVVVETRTKHPLLPMRVALDRNRGGSYLIFLLVGAGLFAMFFFLSLYLQQVQGWSPLKSGVAVLPFSLGIIVMAAFLSRILPRTGPRPLMITGLAFATTGMLLLIRTTPDSSYWTTVLPAVLIMSIGMAMVFIPASSTALVGVLPHDAGVASALLNTAQQVGGSLGLALLSTLSISATSTKVTDLVKAGGNAKDVAVQHAATVYGFHVGYFWGAMLLALGMLVAIFLVNAKRDQLPAEGAVAAA